MSRIDRVKEEIGWLKVVFTVGVALDATLIAWLAQNYDAASRALVVTGLVVAFVFSVIILSAVRCVYARLKELENL